METRAFPRKPYDEVESAFVRGEIRRGSFDDIEHRRYVNELVWLEWYTLDRTPSGVFSTFGGDVNRYRLAARRPDAYDVVRESLDATTRADISFQSGGDPDPAERQAWARKHADGWAAAARGDTRDRSKVDPQERNRKRRLFGRFRFPVVPYETVQSEFTREELHRGSFDNLEHRRYVNKLVWLEWYATGQTGSSTPGALGPVVTNWKLAAGHPEVFDIVRREVGASTRESLGFGGEVACSEEEDLDERARELKRAWQAV